MLPSQANAGVLLLLVLVRELAVSPKTSGDTPNTGIWHVHNLQKTDADKVLRLEWKAPFPAQWRADFRQDDGLTDSWEMLHQRPDGRYGRADWFGQSDAYGTPDWMQADRKRWTTVLGSFRYPCWIDNDGQGLATDLRTSDIAQEIRRRTQTMLRNPVSYEAPRH